MAYKPPESKREGCHYPNCSGYLEVPFCCHDPESFPALKAKLAQIKIPKQWVGLTEEERDKIILGRQQRWEIAHMIEAKLKEKNT